MSDQPVRGFVYAATGADYVTLARRSARSLRRVIGDSLPIDLFTDATVTDPVFDRVHSLATVSRRPKVEALLNSRFDRTIYLDCDTICIAPIDDIFDILEHFELAICAEQRRNDQRVRQQHPLGDVPVAFPQPNSGLIGLRKTDATRALLSEWHRVFHAGAEKYDQHSLRYLLFHSHLRFHTLPVEYNVMFLGTFMGPARGLAAPRLLHLPKLHQKAPGDPMRPFIVAEELGPKTVDRLTVTLQEDHTLTRHVSLTDGAILKNQPPAAVPSAQPRPLQRLRGQLRERLRRLI
ncbi:MAG: putative nucleotide-diphospho-sugar transferase [Paracoccus sp. (in: a-proteobacteria)]|uniref:putative nucleotide-diphospho-sugar transferase n=1 Tax=Paracoccus sp. TaxID=267 RepID=UPI00391D7FA3